MLTLDPWQEEVLVCDSNICCACGRQTGKSTVISIKAAKYAVEHEHSSIMIISAVERQAELLFQKVLSYLLENYKTTVKMGVDKPTKHELRLKNGSVIRSLPAGLSGTGIRGFTIDLLIVDEAAFVPDEVFFAITPALLTKPHSRIILLGTPHGRQGYFYDSFKSPLFKAFHIASWDSPRSNKEFLEAEKARMTHKDYIQEYGGEFVEGLFQFFSNELIRSVMVLDRFNTSLPVDGVFFLGVDVARMGSDQTVLVGTCRINGNSLKQSSMEITEKTLLTETVIRIKNADRKYKFKKIYIDDGGMGVGVFDPLLSDEQTRRKVVPINNATRSLDRDDRTHKKLLKEDLYNNLLYLMESHKIELFDDPEIMLSLSSVQYEYTDRGEMKIFGNYTHITEALIRAAWCMKDKSLNIWCK